MSSAFRARFSISGKSRDKAPVEAAAAKESAKGLRASRRRLSVVSDNKLIEGIATLGVSEESKMEEHHPEHVIKMYAGLSKKVRCAAAPCCACVRMCGCMFVCMFVCMCAHVRVRVRVHVQVLVHVHVYVHVRVRVHACRHASAFVPTFVPLSHCRATPRTTRASATRTRS
jgi:hypothetical protein